MYITYAPFGKQAQHTGYVSAPRGTSHPVGVNPTRAIDCSP